MREIAPTLPIDSLLVSRKVMPGSKSTIRNEVFSSLKEFGLPQIASVSYREVPRIAVDILGQDEFADHRFSHSNLGLRSIFSLIEGFNRVAKHQRYGLSDYVSEVPLGEASYDNVDEGIFVIGFMTSPEFRRRMFLERAETIDILLDKAGLDTVDPFREWRTAGDESDFWIPAMYVATTAPGADRMLDELTDCMSERTGSVAIDIYDALAKPRVVDYPVEKLPEQFR